jgi:hypothetical protein
MLTFFGNAFSPFSRKVQLALEYKGVDYEMVDGLSRGYHEWFVKEIEEGRVLWPKLGIPASTKKR